MEVRVQRGIVVPPDAEVAGCRRRPGLRLRLVEEMVRLIQVGALQVAPVGVDRASLADLPPHHLPRIVQHLGRTVGGVAQKRFVLDHPGQPGVV